MKCALLLVDLLLLSSAALAQDSNISPNASEQLWHKYAQGFSTFLVITNEPELFLREWDSTPTEHAPSIYTINAAKRGTTATGLVIFSGCKADPQGNCDTEVAFRVFRPDESIYADLPESELWRGKPAPSKGVLQVGVAFLGFRIEPDDPLGDYHIEAVVRDKVAGIELVLTSVLHVLPAEGKEMPSAPSPIRAMP